MAVIVLFTKIKAVKKIVFDLSRSIELHKIATTHTNEKAIAGKIEGLIESNETVTWRAKHLGVYQNFTSKVIGCKESEYFADEMISGAFKSFKHEHYFCTNESDSTILIDVLEFKLPFGFLGKLVDAIFLKRYMTNFLKIRNKTIKEFAETNKWKEILN
ncbi:MULTISPECIES: SRPBCC family protein [unclassified Tenacibaculum]|uniref:SRPBCC family protein n=1 Tax=unclassified Tenacibaculum TaxID=2635139 RepID=UPI001F2A2762|nr:MULTISPECIES: SRPBCC family protein [unclassified Tenacibaculum]MCF2873440.1 SRPBCC family protein [Tenacibaculum sp. Cn5-1]MCF2933596.1 SRPBCC family protein [Tenacibaculum sp. Cn5-34]MCG7509822.1 SRPBCC family protein [Tenacibaculum sp. Cn5-46]